METPTTTSDNSSTVNQQKEQEQTSATSGTFTVYHTPQTYRLSRRRLSKNNSNNSEDEDEYASHVLPWEEASTGPQSLFKTRPPDVKYPTGITDPNQIRFYTITIDGYKVLLLFNN